MARKIHANLGEFKIDVNDAEFMKIYDYEYYDYDNIEFIKKAYKEFQPVFDIIKDEVKMQNRNFFDEFKFEMTPLLKFFLIYLIVNTIIIFYKRIKNPPILRKIIKNESNIEEKKESNLEQDNNNNKQEKEKIN